MTRRRRDRLFLFASAAAGFGGIVVLPLLTLMIVGTFATRVLGWQPDGESDNPLLTTCLILGLALGLLVGPAVYFALSRPPQRRSPYHWWRLVRVYLLATVPVLAYNLFNFWGFPPLASSGWDVGVLLWVLLVPPLCWLPDLYRREMPRVRAGFYRRARWVRRNGAPIWLNAAFAALLFVVFALLSTYVIGAVLRSPTTLARLGLTNGRAQVMAILALCLAIPYVASRCIFSYITWRLVDDGAPRCPRCGYDLTGNQSGKCPECGQAAGSVVTMTPPVGTSG